MATQFKTWRPTWNAHCDWCKAASEILYDVPDDATGEFDSVCAKCASIAGVETSEDHSHANES